MPNGDMGDALPLVRHIAELDYRANEAQVDGDKITAERLLDELDAACEALGAFLHSRGWIAPDQVMQ